MRGIVPFMFLATCLLHGQQELVSIQAAIERAKDGDVIRVPPGRYEERIDFKGKSIRVIAWDFEQSKPGVPRNHIIVPPPEDGVLQSVVTMAAVVLTPGDHTREMVLEGFAIREGTAEQGGGVAIRGDVLVEVYRCEIMHNQAIDRDGVEPGGQGGGIYIDAVASATILSCTVAENAADNQGGAIYVSPAADDGPAQGTFCLVNCTITRNRSAAATRDGAAVFLSSLSRGPCIYNNIIWGNLPADQTADLASNATITGHCNLLGITAGVDCETCVDGSPEFLFDPAVTPPAAAADLGAFRLSSNSPAIDRACDPSHCLVRPYGRGAEPYGDIMGNVPVGPRDCGSDEYFVIFVRADSNIDTTVDQGDPIHILQYLFVTGSPVPPCADAADVNDDGKLDIADGIYALYFLWAGGPPPRPPHPNLGKDPTEDSLDCEYYPEPPR